ncbi:CBS domain-containing protein [Amycolatopsis sp. CA-230715]|uniref:CBS domain-containing protein n=1 Tax=Amycolatopsis sp. CA-230715 TaxID=2745196 RepID=UPI001C038534|nr:CBS domain-containing protein [Amycolatopsis sp. CA-230715]QWF77998.1 Inosine-5'-monophosphate dehydrogenase [Amycolatopsis sp. CA-230715]
MQAHEIMTRPVVRVGPSTPVREAVALLTEHGVAALPVVDADSRVVGVFTESDALRAETTENGFDPARRVRERMTTPVEVVSLDTDAREIARRMLGDRLRSVPVVDDGVLVGIVSRRDVLRPLVRGDDSIAARLLALLTDYSGHRDRWSVEVIGGAVTIRGEFHDDAERQVVRALARTVPGVVSIELGPQDAGRPAEVAP